MTTSAGFCFFFAIVAFTIVSAQERGDDSRICRYGCRQHNLFGLWYLWFMIALMVLTVIVMARMCCFYMKVKKARLTGPEHTAGNTIGMPYPYNHSSAVPPVAFVHPPPQYSDVVRQDSSIANTMPMYAASSRKDEPTKANDNGQETEFFARQQLQSAENRETFSPRSPPLSGRLPPLPAVNTGNNFNMNDAENGSVHSARGSLESTPRERMNSVSLSSPGLPDDEKDPTEDHDPVENKEVQKKSVSFSGFFEDENRSIDHDMDEDPEDQDDSQTNADIVEATELPEPDGKEDEVKQEPEEPVTETEVPLGPRPTTGENKKYDIEALIASAKTDGPPKTEAERVYEVVSLPKMETEKDEKETEQSDGF